MSNSPVLPNSLSGNFSNAVQRTLRARQNSGTNANNVIDQIEANAQNQRLSQIEAIQRARELSGLMQAQGSLAAQAEQIKEVAKDTAKSAAKSAVGNFAKQQGLRVATSIVSSAAFPYIIIGAVVLIIILIVGLLIVQLSESPTKAAEYLLSGCTGDNVKACVDKAINDSNGETVQNTLNEIEE